MLWIAVFAIAFIILLLLAEKMRIGVRYNSRMGVKLAFTLLNITYIYDPKKHKRRRKRSGYSSAYPIIKRLLDVLGSATLRVQRLAIAYSTSDNEEHVEYYRKYRYHAAISAALAYLREKSQKLIIYDNAIILIPDGNVKFDIHVTLTLKLFHVLRACVDLLIIYHKENAKRRRRNVGN